MAARSPREPPADSTDPVDNALKAFWRGDTSRLDRLLESDKLGEPRIGELFHHLLHSQARPFGGLERQSRVGGYQIIREIGRGGMGIVYEAQQREPRRPVALKVLPGLYADEFHVRLFRREVQVLARLKHPAIAPIYEAGQTEAGYHFFTMELVSGVPLNRYVRDNAVAQRARLQLFLEICGAVHYAHQRGVIHRDLKPSNILIDTDGNPKILDFGLARITDPDATRTTVITEAGKIMGTLSYMSPEQVRGAPDEIDVRSDVYSLGVILYELLTDRSPYEPATGQPHEVVRRICEEMPRRPSTINRTLPADLETIALKALEKEPHRRYQSAAALAEDVERYHTNQPILARPPSAVYQLRKLVARHKVPFAFMATVFVLLAVVSIWMSVLYKRALRAEAAVRLEADKARSQRESLIEADLVARGSADLLQEMVAKGEQMDEAAERIISGFSDRPRVVAELRERIGNKYRILGLHDAAELHLRYALAIRERFSEEEPAELAVTLTSLAHLLRDKGDHDEAETLYQRALAIRREVWGEEHASVAESLTDLGNLQYRKEDDAAARSLYHQALAIRQRLGDSVEQQVAVAKSLLNLAELHHGLGEHELAESFYDQALATYRQAGGEPLVEAKIMNSLANLLRQKGDLEAAERMHRDVLEVRREHLGNRHRDIGTTLMNLAALLREKGDYVEAEQRYREALDIYRDLLGNEHQDVGGPLVGLGFTLVETGDPAGAEPLLREALRIWEQRGSKDERLTAEAQSILGQCLTALGQYQEAEPFVLEGYAAIKDLCREGDNRIPKALKRIIALYDAWGRLEEAAAYRALLPTEEPSGP